MKVSDLAKHRFMEACKTAELVSLYGYHFLRIGDHVIEIRSASDSRLLEWLVEALRGGKA